MRYLLFTQVRTLPAAARTRAFDGTPDTSDCAPRDPTLAVLLVDGSCVPDTNDDDGDGAPDALDCAPRDPRRTKADEVLPFAVSPPLGREIYSRRMGTVEPVFGNLQNKGMRRFTLRGQRKVSAQWKLFTMAHNIEKVAGAAMR